MAQILQGLSTGRLPHTQGGEGQAKENGVNAAIALANSFTRRRVGRGHERRPPPPVVRDRRADPAGQQAHHGAATAGDVIAGDVAAVAAPQSPRRL